MKKTISFLSLVIFLYFLSGAIVIRYFIDELVFLKIEESETKETIRLVSRIEGMETLIRGYGNEMDGRCVVFFPGRGGGIPRYEKDLFFKITKLNIPIFALSYPGYEGAKGSSTFLNIIDSTSNAVSLLEKEGLCLTKKSIFVGRSLGASIALGTAARYPAKGMVLDSVGLSLSAAVEYQLKKKKLLSPLLVLPIENLLLFNENLLEKIGQVKVKNIYIYQGNQDSMTPYHELANALKKLPEIHVVEVLNANHSNAYKVAGDQYINTLRGLINDAP